MLRHLAAAAALVLSAACAPVAPTATTGEAAAARECARQGGSMRPVGRMQTVQCVVRYADAGKRCTSGEQCQGDCRAEEGRTFEGGAPAAGVCQATSNRFGCYTRVENGRAETTICVD